MRIKRAVANFSTGAVYTAVTVVTGLVATPLLLKWLGEEQFGAFRTATDWFGYLLLLEMGLSGSLLALLARATGERDEPAVNRILSTGVRHYLRVSLAIVCAGLALTYFIPRLVPVEPGNVTDLRIGSLLGLLATLWLPLAAPFRALVESRQRGYVLNGLLLAQTVSITGLSLLMAWLGWGITGQFLAVVLGGVGYYLPLVWQGLRNHPGVLRGARSMPPDTEVERGLKEMNTPTLVLNLCGRLSVQTDNIILALMLGPAMVVPLFVSQRLAVLILGQLQGIGNASWAALAELHFQGQGGRFSSRLIQLTGLVGVLGVAALTPVVVYNETFVTLWVGAERYGGMAVNLVAALNAYLLGIFSLWSWCFGGTGKVRLLMWSGVAQTVINVALSVLLTWQLGLPGPLIGTLAGFVAVSSWYLPYALRRHFEIPAAPLVQAAAWPLLSSLPFGAALTLVAQAYPPGGWFGLATHMALAGVAYLAIAYLLVLGTPHRAMLHQQLRFILRRNPA